MTMMTSFADWLTSSALGISLESGLGKSVQYFIADSITIILLLVLITHAMSLLRYYLPVEKLRDFLTSKKLYGSSYFFASLFGAITPFCSCSSIPLFIGFLEAGIPLGITFAFLITSPLINEVAVALMLGVFGWKVTLLYVVAGMTLGIFGGFMLGKLHMERYVADFVWKIKSSESSSQRKKKEPFSSVLRFTSKEAFSISAKIIPYVLAGVIIGALIHGYVPTGYFDTLISRSGIFAVPIAVLVGVPLYSNATGVIPIIESLIAKGIPLGTALSFMMAVVGLSLPEALILKKVMKWKLLAAFFGIVALGIMVIGYLFNFIRI